MNFRLLSEFLYQSEPVKEFSSKELVSFLILTNGIYFVWILGSSIFPVKFESACGVVVSNLKILRIQIRHTCYCLSENSEPSRDWFLYGTCHVGTNIRSSNMALKVLTWSNSQLNSLCSFHASCLLIHVVHVFESEFTSGIKDVTFVLIYILFIC